MTAQEIDKLRIEIEEIRNEIDELRKEEIDIRSDVEELRMEDSDDFTGEQKKK